MKAIAIRRSAQSVKRTKRKATLYSQYSHLLQSPVTLLLRPSDYTVAELTSLRATLSSIPVQSPTFAPRFTMLRSGLVQPVLSRANRQHTISHLQPNRGPLAVLTMQELDPPTLLAALQAVTKASAIPSAKALAQAAAQAKGKAKAVEKVQRLPIVSGLLEQRPMLPAQVSAVAQLPSKQDLMGQIVGLIEGSTRQIVAVLDRVAGGDLVRNLEAYQRSRTPEQSAN